MNWMKLYKNIQKILKYVKNSKYEGFFDENEAFEFLSTVKYEF